MAPAAIADPGVGGWLNALLLLMFAYGGFESSVIPLAEAKDPGRDAPFALLAGLALVTLLYLVAQLVVLATLPDPDATNRALAESTRVMLGAGGAAVITVAALISVYGWLASNMLSVPRLSMAMAERGDFPSVLARVHPTLRTPWVSVLAFAGLSWVLANQSGLLQNLSLSAVSRLVVYGLVCASLPVFRRRDAHASPDGRRGALPGAGRRGAGRARRRGRAGPRRADERARGGDDGRRRRAGEPPVGDEAAVVLDRGAG